MEANLEITLLMIITVAAGISAQVIADYLKVPSIVFLLLFGITLGPSGLGIIHPTLLGQGLDVIVSLLVALILFDGSLKLQLREVNEVSSSIRNLVTTGTLITLIGGSFAAHWLSEFPWAIAFLYAALVVVTGPTVINPLVKQVRPDRKVAALLEGEGVLIDPIGAILAVVVLNIVLEGNANPVQVIGSLMLRLGVGGAIGVGGGWLIGLFLKQARSLSEDLKNLTVLAGVWSLFGVAQVLISESGLMTMVTAGVMLRIAAVPEERLLRRFKGQLSILAVSVLFILLSADLSIASIFALGWGGTWTVLVLMLIIRPLNVLISTWNSDLNWRQKTFLAWIAPRGIVAASVASLFSISLTKQGINGGDAIKALVFLTIMLTIFVPGLTARWVAEGLKIRSETATGAMIVGCTPFGRLLGRLIQMRGEPVVMIDTNPEACRQARKDNLPVYLTSALDMEVLEEAGLSQLGTFLSLTTNAEVNFVLAQRVMEEFHPPRVLAIYPYNMLQTKGSSDKVSTTEIQHAFSEQLLIKDWNQYLNSQETKLGETVLDAEKIEFQQAHLQALIHSGTLIPLLVERQEQLRVVLADENWQPGDRIVYLLHTPKFKAVSPATTPAIDLKPQLPMLEQLPVPKPEYSNPGQGDS